VAGRDYAVVEDHLRKLAGECGMRLTHGAAALDVVEFAVTEMEQSGLYVAGRGSAPNTAGYVELDASIMDGWTRAAGAVAAIRDIKNPVGAARRVMDASPHVLLVGAGALAFAREQGLEVVEDPAGWYMLPVGVYEHERHEHRHGTVGAVALDTAGRLAAATSTGGTFGKLEGRVGDSPLIGAGTWADDTVAISCTGTGEHIIRAGGALAIAYRIRAGDAPEAAVDGLLREVARLGGEAGVIVVTRDAGIIMRYNSQGMKRAAIGSSTPLSVATFAAPT
jgi:L-asparaginase / beta-aspartyl-peptidase